MHRVINKISQLAVPYQESSLKKLGALDEGLLIGNKICSKCKINRKIEEF